MKLEFSSSDRQASLIDKWSKIHSKLCGLAKSFVFSQRSSNDPHLICISPNLTGIHRLLKRPDPGLVGYNITGVGLHRDEALIKAIGELHERYAHLVAEYVMREPFTFDSLASLKIREELVLPEHWFNFLTTEQYQQLHFPFKPFDPQTKIGWYRLNSALNSKQHLWIPAQLLFIGYNLKLDQQEPWLYAAFTCGTATHSLRSRALLNAILELIQTDVAMGTWYSHKTAKYLSLDSRLSAFKNILARYGGKFSNHIEFYIFETPEKWISFNVACVYRQNQGYLPKLAIGLGSDLSLEQALYKAFLECYGVMLAIRYRLLHFNAQAFNPAEVYDTDASACYYGLGSQLDYVNSKFPVKQDVVQANDLLPDNILPVHEQVKSILNQMKKYHKSLYVCELPTPESKSSDFYNYRVWSPDFLPMFVPSAPMLNHPRYQSYGGISEDFTFHPF